MRNLEIATAKVYIVMEIIEYVPNLVVIKAIIKKTAGNVTAVSYHHPAIEAIQGELPWQNDLKQLYQY